MLRFLRKTAGWLVDFAVSNSGIDDPVAAMMAVALAAIIAVGLYAHRRAKKQPDRRTAITAWAVMASLMVVLIAWSAALLGTVERFVTLQINHAYAWDNYLGTWNGGQEYAAVDPKVPLRKRYGNHEQDLYLGVGNETASASLFDVILQINFPQWNEPSRRLQITPYRSWQETQTSKSYNYQFKKPITAGIDAMVEGPLRIKLPPPGRYLVRYAITARTERRSLTPVTGEFALEIYP